MAGAVRQKPSRRRARSAEINAHDGSLRAHGFPRIGKESSHRHDLARKEEKSLTGDIVPVTIDPARLLTNLNRLLRDTGLSNPLKLEQLQRILDQSTCVTPGLDPFTDDQTGLTLPPPAPAEYYSGHQTRLRVRLFPEDFLRRFWAPYVVTHPHMLFAPHLRDHDSALVAALRNRARSLKVAVDDFFFQHGILTRAHLAMPPKGVERQARLFKAITHARQAATILQTIPRSIESSDSGHSTGFPQSVKSQSRD